MWSRDDPRYATHDGYLRVTSFPCEKADRRRDLGLCRRANDSHHASMGFVDRSRCSAFCYCLCDLLGARMDQSSHEHRRPLRMGTHCGCLLGIGWRSSLRSLRVSSEKTPWVLATLPPGKQVMELVNTRGPRWPVVARLVVRGWWLIQLLLIVAYWKWRGFAA